MIYLLTPQSGSTHSLLSDYHRMFYTMYETIPPEYRETNDNNPWCGLKPNGVDYSFPRPVLFSWYCTHTQNTFQIHISRHADFHDERLIAIGNAHCAPVYNLEVGRDYYAFVDCTGDGGYEKSDVVPFATAAEYPRAMMVPYAVSNMRDIGGGTSFDGHRIRQGLLYRGEAEDEHMDRGETGLRVFCDEIGIRTVVDLRGGYVDRPETVNAVLPPERAAWYQCPMCPYDGIANESCRASLAHFVSLLCDKTNLPLYYHCLIGTDRTGTAAALIQLLLHIPRKWIDLDYDLSALANNDWTDRLHLDIDTLMFDKMREVTGIDDPYSAAERFTLDFLGLKPWQLASLRAIFWET